MGKRNAATAYANKWKGKDDDVHNPKYLSWGSNDCTDFISQCLRAGGWRFVGPIPHVGGAVKDNSKWFCAHPAKPSMHPQGWAYTASWNTARGWRASKNKAKRVIVRKRPEAMNHSMFCYSNPTGKNPRYYQHGGCAKSDARSGLRRTRKAGHPNARLWAYRVISCD